MYTCISIVYKSYCCEKNTISFLVLQIRKLHLHTVFYPKAYCMLEIVCQRSRNHQLPPATQSLQPSLQIICSKEKPFLFVFCWIPDPPKSISIINHSLKDVKFRIICYTAIETRITYKENQSCCLLTF